MTSNYTDFLTPTGLSFSKNELERVFVFLSIKGQAGDESRVGGKWTKKSLPTVG